MTTQFWTFSGINSPYDAVLDRYEDYTWPVLSAHIGIAPDRRYASRLGTGDHYDADHNVLSLRSEAMLDAEAEVFAHSGGGFPPIAPGSLIGQQVKVMLVAPKTTTRPPRADGLTLEVYWNPNDYVPNQSMIHPDSFTYWESFLRGGGVVWPVENRLGQGLGYGHDFDGFIVTEPWLLMEVWLSSVGSAIQRSRWIRSSQRAPSPIHTLSGWLGDPNNDLVLFGHSQGANLIMHLLQRGYQS